jgi:hypothetical protein
MKRTRLLLVGALFILAVFFESCLGKEDRYQCNGNRKNALSLVIDEKSLPNDSYTSGAVLSILEGDTLESTFLEMNIMSEGTPYILFIKLDTLGEPNIDYNQDNIIDAYLGVNDDKFPMSLSKIRFSDLNDFVPSNFGNLFYYGIAQGTFEGKFLKTNAIDL